MHACPVCSARLRYLRTREIHDVIKAWSTEGGEVGMLTLTLRHSWGDSLRRIRLGLTAAWRRMFQGRAGARLRDLFAHYVRALDVTHGPNGWHPHLHALLFVRDAATISDALDELRVRWADAVGRELGEMAVPRLDEVGVQWSAHCSRADYVCKLGLELNEISRKTARPGHLGPWQIARLTTSADTKERCRALRLWREWVRDMKGARHLTWSRRCRALASLADEEDIPTPEIDPEVNESRRWVVSVPASLWRYRVGAHWSRARPASLLAASRRSLAATLAELRKVGLVPDRYQLRTLASDGSIGAHVLMRKALPDESSTPQPARSTHPLSHARRPRSVYRTISA
ncbi:MAG: protein rep [Gemmatimonadota bacterium]|nr:MAG: protein rep [Gemmatimonadota bacterium]